MLIVTAWGIVSALAVYGGVEFWKRTKDHPKGSAIVAPGGSQGPDSDHERRLVAVEYKFKALELEWEDTRAKFLGMTRSLIRQAKAAGLDGSNGDVAAAASSGGSPSPDPSTRAAVLARYRREHGAGQPR